MRMIIAIGLTLALLIPATDALAVENPVHTGGQVETKLAKVEIYGDWARGKIRARKKACVRNRKVTLKGPEPLWIGDPAASRVAQVELGTDRTNGEGGWWIGAPPSSYLNLGSYVVRVKRKRLPASRGGKVCASAIGLFET